MTYAVVNHWTPELPRWPGNGTPFGVIGCHTTEGAAGEKGAWDTLAWMVATAAQRGASYHELLWWEPERKAFGVLRVVEPRYCAGSVGIGASLNPDAWVRECLTRSGNLNDPNQGVYAVAICGTTKQVDEWSDDPMFVGYVHRRLLQIRDGAPSYQKLPLDRLAEHFRFNPTTRTDWGRLPKYLTLEQRKASPAERAKWHSKLADKLGGLVLKDSLPEVQQAEMPLSIFKAERWTVRAGAPYFDNPNGKALGALAGGQARTISRSADNMWLQIGIESRIAVLGGKEITVPGRLAWVRMADLTPDSPAEAAAFDAQVGGVLYDDPDVAKIDEGRLVAVKTMATEALKANAKAASGIAWTANTTIEKIADA